MDWSADEIRALTRCAHITRHRARNFYYGLRLSPRPKRDGLYAVYAWMRLADDLCDDAPRDVADARDRIRQFAAATSQVLSGGEVPGELDPDSEEAAALMALRATNRRWPLPAAEFAAMLQAQADDLLPRRLKSWEEASRFCAGMASTVGKICLAVWGADGATAPALAGQRGLAFQLTNVLRDFAEDFDRGRVYLPLDEFESAALRPEELRHWARPAECARFVGSQVARARGFYAASAPLDALVHAECRSTLWAMTEIYRGVLERIAREPRCVASGTARLGLLRKLRIGLAARAHAAKAGA